MFMPSERIRSALLVAAVVLIVAASGAAYRGLGAQLEAEGLVEHTLSVIDHVDRLLAAQGDAGAATRAYLLSGNEGELSSYSDAIKTTSDELAELRTLVADNPSQIGRLATLGPLIAERRQFLARLIAARQSAPSALPSYSEQLDAGLPLARQIRQVTREMTDEEGRLYSSRQRAAADTAITAKVLIVVGTALGLLSIGLVIVWMTLEVRRRREAEARLTEANATLEQRVAERTVEISQQLDQIGAQAAEIRMLSTPVLQLREGLLILPLIGVVDATRAQQMTSALLTAVRDRRARAVIIDVTGVVAIDSQVANRLLMAARAIQLMGAVVILTGLSGPIAQALVDLGVDLGELATIGELQAGIARAEALLGVFGSASERAARVVSSAGS